MGIDEVVNLLLVAHHQVHLTKSLGGQVYTPLESVGVMACYSALSGC